MEMVGFMVMCLLLQVPQSYARPRTMPWGVTLHTFRSFRSPIAGAFDCEDQSIDVFGENMADGADAEAIDAGDFSGINHEAFFLEQIVEFFEIIRGGFGIVEACDDRTVQLVCKMQRKPRRSMPATKRRWFSV